MGISGLSQVLADNAPSAVRENEIKNYFGRIVAIDASMSIYQFLIAVRSDGQNLTNEAGETTSHLMGMFYRTIRMAENGIKPVYVFDGKPPALKSGELKKRSERRQEAEKSIEGEKETGDAESIEKFTRRTVRVTSEHNNECKRLLRLMGIPYVEAPCEAEAQCAALCKGNKVFATASEDMDSITFGTPVLLRHLTFSEARKMPISEYHHERALEGLQMSQDQFIDLCILLGCDYCDSIRGIGPKKAVEYIKKYGTIEQVLANLDKSKYPVPDDWNFQGARQLFKEPEVLDPSTVDRGDGLGVLTGLERESSGLRTASEERIRSAVKKLEKSRGSATQGRLDAFFKVTPGAMVTPTKRKRRSVSEHRQVDTKADDKNKKAKKGGPGFKGGK